MSDAILVVNAGSSSIKFTEFIIEDEGALAAAVNGSIEELSGAARFRARDAKGQVVGEHAWGKQAPPHHAGALAFLFEWLRVNVGDAHLAAVGHRVVHGGEAYAAPIRVDAAVLTKLTEGWRRRAARPTFTSRGCGVREKPFPRGLIDPNGSCACSRPWT